MTAKDRNAAFAKLTMLTVPTRRSPSPRRRGEAVPCRPAIAGLTLIPRLEIDIAGMRERLDHIIELLASDQRSSDTRSCPLPAAEARYESDDPDFPVMILQRRTMMLVLGLDQNTGAWLSNMERSTRLSSNQHQAGLSRMMLLLQPHGVSSTLQAFSERVHVWLPILTSDFYDSFSQCISG